MYRTTGRLVAAVVSVALCTSCSGSLSPATGPPASPVALVGAGAAKTMTAELRAGLTYLLTEHVYATGLVAQAVIDARGKVTGPAVVAALAALHGNSDELSVALTRYTPAAHDAFLQVWEQHTRLFVDYAVGRGGHDDAQTVQVRAALEVSGNAVAGTIHEFVPELPVAKKCGATAEVPSPAPADEQGNPQQDDRASQGGERQAPEGRERIAERLGDRRPGERSDHSGREGREPRGPSKQQATPDRAGEQADDHDNEQAGRPHAHSMPVRPIAVTGMDPVARAA